MKMAYLKGIDVSHHQGNINWSKVDNDIKFVLIKATEGKTYVDPNFHANYSGAKSSGRKVGAYHFARFSNTKEAQAEALHFLSVIDDYKLDFHILDLEVGTGDLTNAANAFFEVLRDHKRGGLFLYTGPAFMSEHLKKDVVANDVKLWIAHYGVDKPTILYWPDWAIWQYTSSGKVSGISGRVDMNYAKPDILGGQIEQMSLSKPKPKPKPKNVVLLRKGDKGAAVKELQEKLLKAGEKLPRYGADGDFGNETEQAVKAFQARHGLAVDGIVGPKTRAKLDEVLKAKSKPKNKASIVPYPGHLIKRGSRGRDVERIQRAVGVTPDGIFGPKTEAAVKAYQKRHGLAVDGIVGPKTWSVMF